MSSVYVLQSGIERVASSAVDGIYDVDEPDRVSMAHSQLELRPWWRVYLVGTHCVWAVNILNRYDGN